MADKPNTQSTLGAALRGLLNGASLGLADEALTGISKLTGGRDYGQDLRDNEILDKIDHPYVTTASELAGSVAPTLIPGVGEGNIARVLLNPAVQGAVSAVGNSNDLANGDIAGAVGHALVGGLEGTAISRALGTIGNKLADGTFGKPEVVDTDVAFLRNNNVPTPNQYIKSPNTLTDLYRESVRNATNRSQFGLNANQQLLATVNRNFPGAAIAIRDMDNPEQLSILQKLDRNTGGSYNGLALKEALDNAVDNHGVNMRNSQINGDYESMIEHNDAATELLNSPLYQLAQSASPIHQAIEQAATAPVADSGNVLTRHLPSAIGTGLGIVTGHLIGGPVLGLATELTPKVYNTYANRTGTNAIRDALANPNPVSPGINRVRQSIGNVVRGDIASQVPTQVIVHATNDSNLTPEDAFKTKLRGYGWTDEEINSINNQPQSTGSNSSDSFDAQMKQIMGK